MHNFGINVQPTLINTTFLHHNSILSFMGDIRPFYRHFFTGDAEEASKMQLTGIWNYEGIGLVGLAQAGIEYILYAKFLWLSIVVTIR